MSMSDRLDEITARCDAATEGSWWGSMIDGRCEVFAGTGSGSDPMLAAELLPGDAEFVVNARTDLPRLVAALRAVLELHVSQFDRAVDHNGEPGTYCDACNVGPWPCPTVRVVQAALGEEASDE